MSFQKYDDVIITSIYKFLSNDFSLVLDNTSERSWYGRLAIYIDAEMKKSHDFHGYYLDIEYNRNFGGRVKTIINKQMEIVSITCDMIIHSRGEKTKDNLVAIEMKKSTANLKEKNSDKVRLIALTSKEDVWRANGLADPDHVCGYDIGYYVEINVKKREFILEYYKNGVRFENSIFSFTDLNHIHIIR